MRVEIHPEMPAVDECLWPTGWPQSEVRGSHQGDEQLYVTRGGDP